MMLRKRQLESGCTERQKCSLDNAINEIRYFGSLKLYIDWEDIEKWM